MLFNLVPNSKQAKVLIKLNCITVYMKRSLPNKWNADFVIYKNKWCYDNLDAITHCLEI